MPPEAEVEGKDANESVTINRLDHMHKVEPVAVRRARKGSTNLNNSSYATSQGLEVYLHPLPHQADLHQLNPPDNIRHRRHSALAAAQALQSMGKDQHRLHLQHQQWHLQQQEPGQLDHRHPG